MRKRFVDLFAPLRFRDFRLLWGAEVFSQLGDWAGRLALAVTVAERTHSTLLTALVTTASVVPYIGIGQVLAAYANRFPRVRTIIVADIGRALLFGVLVIPMPIAMILVLAFLAGCLTVPFEAARNSLTPFTVPREHYGDAIAVVSITFDTSILFGYGVGGVMIAVVGAPSADHQRDVVPRFVGASCSNTRGEPQPGGGASLFEYVTVGAHSSTTHLFDGSSLDFSIAGASAVVGESLVAVYALQVLFESAGTSGLLAAAIPAGAIIATILSRTHGDDTKKLQRSSEVALIGSVVGLVVFIAAPGVPAVLIGFAGIGALNASRVPGNEVAVLRLDDRVRVPAFAVINGFLLGGQALAAGLGGLVARQFGVRETIIASLAISGVVGLWGTLKPPHEIGHRIRSTTTPH